MKRDGNCLYHAFTLALQALDVENAPADHIALRRELVEFMESRSPDWFNLPTNMTLSTFIERGDENVVRAAAEHYKKTIHVTSVNEKTRTFDFATTEAERQLQSSLFSSA